MDEFEQVIRRAKPGTSSRQAPLSVRAEVDLARILASPRPDQSVKSPRRLGLPLTLTGIAAALFVFVVIALSVLTPREALAATPPLLTIDTYKSNAKEALKLMSDASQRQGGPDAREAQVIQFESWALNVVEEGAVLTSLVMPERVTIVRAADGSREVSVVAGQPYDASGQPATDRDAPAPGTELWSESSAPNEYQYLFPEQPPITPIEMSLYLETFGGLSAGSASADVLGTVSVLLTEWQLTAGQESALLLVLADLPDLEIAGSVTDRLGRSGVAFQTPTVGAYYQMIVISAATGHILSIETVYVGHDRKDIPSPAVVAYYAWERN